MPVLMPMQMQMPIRTATTDIINKYTYNINNIIILVPGLSVSRSCCGCPWAHTQVKFKQRGERATASFLNSNS